MSRVIVGLSGGVDSAVTAYLLKLAGYEVIGVTLKTWLSETGQYSRCCEIDNARGLADSLDIPYYVINCMGDFKRHITEPFVSSYLSGETPDPCVVCNRLIKWDKMLEAANNLGADFIATGHYARRVRLQNGRYTVAQASYAPKDQSYMLYRLTQEHLERTLFPLGSLTKTEVRSIAQRAGLPSARTPDSQEICFVTQGSYSDFIEEHADPQLLTSGDFTDETGAFLGRHRGIWNYTVGQRKGLGISLGYRAYVTCIDAAENSVVLGTEDSLYSSVIECRDTVYMGLSEQPAGGSFTALVKVRYHSRPQQASAEALEGHRLRLTFDEPVRAAAPGQSAVLYDNEMRVLAGGIIQY